MTTYIRWTLYALALIVVAVAFAFDTELGTIVAGLAILFFGILFLVLGGARLWRGEVKLRPFDAFKKALLVFSFIFGIRCFAWLIFPSLERDLGYALFHATAFAIIFSLYVTAYRKPA